MVSSSQPFVRALIDWFATEVELHDVMVIAPNADLGSVDIEFSIGGGALHGYVHTAGLSVAAIWAGECWDLLFDQDLAAACGPDGWHCTLCPEPDRPQFDTIQRLWVDHLFRPMHEWITTKLLKSTGIGFYGDGGVTWAKLITDDQVDDPPAHIVQLTRSTACPYS